MASLMLASQERMARIVSASTVLPKSYLSTEKESKPLVLARFWLLFPRGKSNPPEA